MRQKFLTLFILLFVIQSNLFSQAWVNMMHDPNANFYATVDSFDSYWAGRTIEKGKGYKVFKRWQAFMEPRVYPSGDVKLASKGYENYEAFKSANPSLFVVSPMAPNNWTFMGPTGAPTNGGAGRLNFVRQDPTNANIIYVGAPDGGIWKTTNGGTSWSTTTDLVTSTCIGFGDLAIDPTNTQILYAGTGDSDASDTYSVGVLKSTNGGTTWNTTGLTWTVNMGRSIRRVLVNPTNTQIVLVASSAGIFRTTDGGTSWTQITTTDTWDMEFKPTDPNTVYASGTFVARSTNNGVTWTTITSGVPTAGVQRIALAVTPANVSYVYLLVGRNSDQGLMGVYRSTDSGLNYTNRHGATPNLLGWSSTGSDAGGQAFYDLSIGCSNTNADEVFVGGINIWRSINGGTSFTINGHWTGTGAPYVHADIHDLVFQQSSGAIIFSANDGGLFKSTNNGTNWTDISSNMGIAQQYSVSSSQTINGRVFTGHQDNGANLLSGGTWTQVYGGDGMDVIIDRTLGTTLYEGYVYGDFRRSTNSGTSWTNIFTSLSGTGNWLTPIKQDPVAANTIYAGYTQLHKSTNQGTTSAAISAFAGTTRITEFVVAPSNVNFIYVIRGSTLQKTTNGGTSWTNVTGTLPVGSAAMTYVTVSNTNPNIVYVTFSGYSSANKVFRSVNGGATWTNISTGLPNLPVNCVVYQAGSIAHGIYVGTDVGVYYRDTTTTWQPFMNGLPNVSVRELDIYTATGKLRAATYGRGTWQSDVMSTNNPPVADFTASNFSGCVGSPINFTDLSSFAPTSWAWTFPSGTPATSTLQNPSCTWATAGTYNVRLIASNAFGSDTIIVPVTITGTTTVTAGLPFTEGFTGATFVPVGWSLANLGDPGTWARTTAAGLAPTAGNSAWFDNFSIDNRGSRDELLLPKLNVSGTTTVTMTFDVAHAQYGTGNIDTLMVFVSTNCGSTWTQVFQKFGTALATNGGAFVTTAFTPTSAQWRNESINLNAYNTASNLWIKFSNGAAYGNNIYLDNVNISVTGGGGPPTAGFTPSATTVCVGQNVTFTNTSTGATSYSWTFPSGTPATSTATSPTVSWSTPGTYNVTLTATNSFGSTNANVNITVVANPAPPTISSNSPVCTGSSINLSSNTIAGATYSWTGPSTFTSSLEDPTRTGATTAMAGTYSCTVTVGGCTSTVATTAVTVNTTPTAPTIGSNSPVCSGNTINLTANTIAGATYSWTGPSSFTSSLEDPTRTGATTAMAGTYSCTVTVGGCTSTVATTAVTVNTTPTAPTIGSNSPVCSGNTINLTANTIAGATYSWTGPSSFTSSLEDPTRTGATTAMAGTYSCTVTVGGCTSTIATTAVVVNTTPAAPTIGSNTPVCVGNAINLTANTVAGATYNWTGPSSFTSSLEDPIRTGATVAMAGTYSCTVTVSGCTSSVATTAVVVNSAPVITTTSFTNPTTCAGSNGTITLNGLTTGTSYTVNYLRNGVAATPVVITASGGAVIITGLTDGNYSNITVTIGGGCSSLPVGPIVLTDPGAPATPTAGSNSPVCVGSTINLTSNTVAGATYSWTGPSSFTSTLEDPTRTGATVAMAGTYSVTVTVAGCTSAPGTTTVVVNTIPTAPTISSNSPVCTGSAINFSANTIAGATYNWTGPSSFTSSLEDPIRTGVTTAMAGTYSCTVTVGGCTSSAATTVVTINTTPAAPTIGSNSPVCTGNAINLTANTIAGATYSWTGPSTFSSSLEDPTITGATTAMAGTYSCTVTVGGCTSTVATTSVTVNTTPTPSITTSATTICSGQSVTLTGSGGGSYSWLPGGSVSSVISVSPTTTTTYTLTVSNGTCNAQATQTINVNASPTVSISPSTVTICSGTTANLTATGASTYSWMPGSLSGTSVSVSPSGTTTYTVTGTDINGCTGVATRLVTVNPLPVVTIGASPSTICEGASSTLTASASTPSNFSWTPTSGSTSTLVVSPTTTTTYTVTATDINFGCISTNTVTVNVNANPIVSAGPDVNVCAGGSITLNGSGATSYVWNNSIIDGVSFTPSFTNLYIVTGTDINGCSDTDTTLVTVNSLPLISGGSNQSICEGNAITLNGSGGVSYTWSSGVINGVAFTPTATTTYTVTGTDVNGCVNTNTVTITVNPNPILDLGTDIVQPNPPALLDAGSGFIAYSWSNGDNSQTTNVNLNGTYYCTVTDANGCTATDSVTVWFTAGIESSDKNFSIELYPNPNDGLFNIHVQDILTDNLTMSIYDMNGKLVFIQSQIEVDNSLIKQIDLSHLRVGLYTMKFMFDKHTHEIRFIKNK